MPDSHIRSPWPAILLAASAAAFPAHCAAQPSDEPRGADALDAAADVPALRVRSSFAGYRRLRDESVASWKDANDTVGRIGGWRAYAREAAQPDAPAQRGNSNGDAAPELRDFRGTDARGGAR